MKPFIQLSYPISITIIIIMTLYKYIQNQYYYIYYSNYLILLVSLSRCNVNSISTYHNFM